MSCCPPPPSCPPLCIKPQSIQQNGRCNTIQLPPVNIVCEIPQNRGQGQGCGDKPSGKMTMCPAPCCPPAGGSVCCPSPCGGCPPPCCPPPVDPCCMDKYLNDQPCGPRKRREKRWPQCNFLKPCIDTRIYRDGEAMSISYAGHIPGEQYISGRNLPTTTTFAKKRLCTFTPYEFVDPDGCCSFCTFP